MKSISIYQETSNNLLFVLLTMSSICLTFIFQEFFIDNELYINYFDNSMPSERLNEIIHFQNTWGWLNYLIVPIIYLIKLSLISLWLITATVMVGYNAKFNQIFKSVLIAEFIMLIPSLIKIIWFGFIESDYSLTDLQFFNPFSLINLYDIESLDPWIVYPLQSINILEIVYVIILAFGIKQAVNKDYDTTLKFTLPAYFSGLITWIIFITFLTINLSN